MTDQQRIENLKIFGYTERESAFLLAAALHSGYFLTRQYLAFIGAQSGYAESRLVTYGCEQRHIRPVPKTRGRWKLYSTFSRVLFDALGEENNRNRRDHSALEIRRRVMLLDYVIEHKDQGLRWLPTETSKVDFFTKECGIDESILPRRVYQSKVPGAPDTVRWFIDRVPICIRPDGIVEFVFIDPGYHSDDVFESFLEDYSPLISALKQASILFTSSVVFRFRRIEGLVHRTFGSPGHIATKNHHDAQQLGLYFSLEERYANTGWNDFELHQMQALKRLRSELPAETKTRFQQAWNDAKTAGIERLLRLDSGSRFGADVSFSTHVLTQSYDLFSVVIGSKKAQKAQRIAQSEALSV